MEKLRVRRGTAAQWTAANPVLRRNEIGIESDTGTTKTGNGVDVWSALPYDAAPGLPSANPGDGPPAWRVLGTVGTSAVGAAQLATGAVTTAKILAANVTAEKLANSAGPPVFSSQCYYSSPGNRGAFAVTNNQMTAAPFWVGVTTTFDRIGAVVTVAGAASTVVRLGIYGDAGNGEPGALILEAGTIAGDSATAQEITISQQLSPGWYHLAAVAQGGTPTMRTVTGTHANPIGAGSLASATLSNPQTGYYRSSVTGAMQTPFSRTDRSATPILVVLRAA